MTEIYFFFLSKRKKIYNWHSSVYSIDSHWYAKEIKQNQFDWLFQEEEEKKRETSSEFDFVVEEDANI